MHSTPVGETTQVVYASHLLMPGPNSSDEVDQPREAARAAGLLYVNDRSPGISRHSHGTGFRYVTPAGRPLRDPKELARIRSLAIPPAWRDVWITSHANGHLQATGRDARGRKQSRYHPHWREVRDEAKYQRMIQFAEALPYIRKHLKHDISLRGLPRLKILATVVSLLEATLIRVGNSEYARDNRSFGLTTMRSRHVQVDSESVTFTFQGKSRVHHVVNLHDRRLAGIIKRCADLPGYELFQYVDHDGQRHRISSSDVNGYLHDMTGQHFTAKDFRTWAGSVLACDLLRGLQPCESENQAKKNIVQAIKEVAARLGNTLAVCRKCYVHPLVLETYLAGETLPLVRRSRPGLHHEELVLLKLLKLRSGDSLR